jgi:pyruvate/2-oxoglutarate dehydrogenase complex dihydrolipoamide dehydrogenase (E3) component
VRTALGPAGAWWLRDRFTPVRHRLGTRVVDASPNGAGVVLTLNGGTADDRLEVAQVIAATGYRVDVDRLGFLAVDLRGRIRRAGGSPRLNGCFESTVPGLYFVGLAAADSFGPAMRFVFGSDYAARRVARAVA